MMLQRAAGNRTTRAVIQAKPQPTLTSTFEDCSRKQKDKIWSSIFVAKRWVQNALHRIWQILGDIGNASRSPKIEETHTLLKSQFNLGTGGSKEDVHEEVVTIYRNLYKIYNAFGRTLPFECESSCSGPEYGYVYAGIWKTLVDNNIHFCPLFFDEHKMYDDLRHHGVIHEMAHKYAGIMGDVYEGRDAFYVLPPSKSIKNADSYASFCHYLSLP